MSDAPEQEKKVARIVTSLPRDQMVPISFPVEFDGVLYEAVRVKRLTGAESLDYANAIASGEPPVVPPVVDVPEEVWLEMDADDRDAVEEIALDCWPRRMRQAIERTLNPPDNTQAS